MIMSQKGFRMDFLKEKLPLMSLSLTPFFLMRMWGWSRSQFCASTICSYRRLNLHILWLPWRWRLMLWIGEKPKISSKFTRLFMVEIRMFSRLSIIWPMQLIWRVSNVSNPSRSFDRWDTLKRRHTNRVGWHKWMDCEILRTSCVLSDPVDVSAANLLVFCPSIGWFSL